MSDAEDDRSEDASKTMDVEEVEEDDATSKMDTGDDDDDDDRADDDDQSGKNVDDVDDDEDDNEDADDDEEDMEGNDEEKEDEDSNDGDDDEDGGSEEEEDSPESPQQDETKRASKKRERYHVPKIFQDAITVLIPLDVTADLKVAVQKTRAKRIKSIYKRFPALQRETKKPKEDFDSDDPMMGEDDEENAKDKEKKKSASKKKKLEHIPQPEQFGSVLDYLEAKYVKGVMLDDNDDDGQALDDGSEGQGSVYSKDSFLDDTDLQRDVAEQVMASTTLTKIELEQEDGDFFVNVGNLELENDDYGENYDPLQDKENTKGPKKKRKKSTASAASGTSTAMASPAKKKKTTPAPKATEPTSTKSKKSTASVTSTKSKKSTAPEKSDKDTSEKNELRKAVKRTKARLDSQFKKGVAMIKNLTDEELPKRKTKLKVALTCPPNKKPGDDITFSYVTLLFFS